MKTKDIALIAMFAALTAVGSLVKIPLGFTPVPITLQVFFVLLAGLMLGPVKGAISILAYVVIGAAGLPVFAGGTGGFQAILGPSGGYLYGFIIAAFVTGLVAKTFAKSKKKPAIIGGAFAAGLAGVAVIYLFGAAHLAFTMKLGPVQAFSAGVAPFIPVDLIKAIVVSTIYAAVLQRGVLNLSET